MIILYASAYTSLCWAKKTCIFILGTLMSKPLALVDFDYLFYSIINMNLYSLASSINENTSHCYTLNNIN